MANISAIKLPNGTIYNLKDNGALQLTGGQVTGPVTFGSSVSIDEGTIGDLVVNGNASFANNINANTINGVAVGSSPKFTDTVTTISTTGSGNAITAITASNGVLSATKGTTFLTGDSTLSAAKLSGAIPSGVTATTQDSTDNSTKIATTAYVTTAIANLPEPMIFKGSVGTGGTITSLPAAAASNEGWTYKVITALSSPAAKVGDTVISNGSSWVVIPSGDEPSGTVTSIAAGTGLNTTSNDTATDGGTITSSGTIYLTKSGVTAGSYGDSTAQTPGYGSTFKVPYITVDKYGRVTGISEHTVKIPASDNTNTTYTLTNALASHKFTWTFTPSSGSATTTTAELVQGTGITLTDDTSNKKITIANAGVTGIKGNAESSYRTGQVNLTPANLGAVALSGNETVAGNKTFSGTTTLSVASTYPTQSGTIIPANATAIIQSPIPKYLWHDIWAFCRAATPKYYTSTNGSSWIEATLEKNLFAHKEAWGTSNVLSSSIQGSRWTWLNGGFYASTASWLVLGVTYKNPSAHFDLLLETSSDGGSTWTTMVSVTDLYYSQTPIWIRNTATCQDSLRLTLTLNANSASNAVLGLCSIRFLTSRWGDQGKGSEFEHPYTWDSSYNISPLSGAKFIGDLTGTATGNLTSVQYDSTNAKLTYTKNGSNTDIVTVATLKSALGSMPASDVYSWAKASTKPTYTASEVGALASNTTYVSTITTTAGTHSAISSKSGAVSFNVPTKTSHLTNDSGYLTGITSSQVTTALGYTPYNSTNPNGYTSNTGTVTKVTAGTGLSIGTTAGGNFTTSGTINHSNSVTAQTTQAVYPIKIDAQGHISAYGSAITIPGVTKTTATLSTTWSSKQQSVTVSGVTTSNTVIVTPAPASYNMYCECGVYCSAQAANSLTFTCDEVPTSSLTVNIVILS